MVKDLADIVESLRRQWLEVHREQPEGALVVTTEGCYSDYGVIGIFRAMKLIPAEGYNFKEDAFLAWICTEGFLDAIAKTRLIGSDQTWISMQVTVGLYGVAFSRLFKS